jgi:hypothetical protein
MERLLHVVFYGFDNVWCCLAEFSFFYQQLCAKELRKDLLLYLEENVALCRCLENQVSRQSDE